MKPFRLSSTFLKFLQKMVNRRECKICVDFFIVLQKYVSKWQIKKFEICKFWEMLLHWRTVSPTARTTNEWNIMSNVLSGKYKQMTVSYLPWWNRNRQWPFRSGLRRARAGVRTCSRCRIGSTCCAEIPGTPQVEATGNPWWPTDCSPWP